jgi:hypothetical protein
MRTTQMHDRAYLAISDVCTREAMGSCVCTSRDHFTVTPLARLRELRRVTGWHGPGHED